MKLKHVFHGVPNGPNTSQTVDARKGSELVLRMKETADAYITVNADADDPDTSGMNEMMVSDDTYDDGDIADRPGSDDACFRLRGPGAGRSDILPTSSSARRSRDLLIVKSD